MEKSKLTDLEEKFCLVYACGPSPYNGNAQKTFDLVFNNNTGLLFDPDEVESNARKDVEVAIQVRQLMLRDDIRERISQIQNDNLVDAATLKPRLTSMLLKIADECSTLMVCDKFGVTLPPAALRAVSVNAASKLIDMYGIKEDIAHKVMLEGADGDGITFNLIVPEINKDNSVDKVIE